MIKEILQSEYDEVYSFVNEECGNEKDAFESEDAKKSILSYFEAHYEQYSYFASFDEGMNGVLAYDANDFRIAFLYVKKQDRRKDIGSSLLDALKEKALQMNIGRITVRAYDQLVHFYVANGFESNGDSAIVELEYLVGRNMIGKKVTVIVDRAYGSYHPTLQDMICPYNFGYIKQDTNLEDSELQDAYVVGVEEPLDEFTGYVVGIIYHGNEATSRWIVAPAGYVVNHEKLIQLLGQEEQFYDTRFIWG